jgi:hypothetical protein
MDHFKEIGSPLVTIQHLPTVHSQKSRLLNVVSKYKVLRYIGALTKIKSLITNQLCIMCVGLE